MSSSHDGHPTEVLAHAAGARLHRADNGGCGKRRMYEALLGSTAHKVIHLTDRPVLVVH